MDSDEIGRPSSKRAIAECEHLGEENASLRLRIADTPDIRDPRTERPSSSDDEKPQPSPVTFIGYLNWASTAAKVGIYPPTIIRG